MCNFPLFCHEFRVKSFYGLNSRNIKGQTVPPETTLVEAIVWESNTTQHSAQFVPLEQCRRYEIMSTQSTEQCVWKASFQMNSNMGDELRWNTRHWFFFFLIQKQISVVSFYPAGVWTYSKSTVHNSPVMFPLPLLTLTVEAGRGNRFCGFQLWVSGLCCQSLFDNLCINSFFCSCGPRQPAEAAHTPQSLAV